MDIIVVILFVSKNNKKCIILTIAKHVIVTYMKLIKKWLTKISAISVLWRKLGEAYPTVECGRLIIEIKIEKQLLF